jgi:polysaccharide biosynthesis protein PslH
MEFVRTRKIDLVQCFYLSTLPVAVAVETMVPTARLQLDLPDIESETRLRLARLHVLRGERRQAIAWEMEAVRCQEMEQEHLRRLARVWVCSETDRTKLQYRYGLENVGVVPNTVSVSRGRGRSPASEKAVFQLLFVGSLNYLPNLDAAEWLDREIIPAIRARTEHPFKVVVAGRDVTGSIQRLARDNPHIEVPGFVPDLADYYARSHCVIVPLRAGGGTRIKIIEAFGMARAVVATTVAVEGLGVKAGVHALIAENAAGLADHCVHLLENPRTAASLVENALALYERCYHPEVMAAAVLENSLGSIAGNAAPTRPV